MIFFDCFDCEGIEEEIHLIYYRNFNSTIVASYIQGLRSLYDIFQYYFPYASILNTLPAAIVQPIVKVLKTDSSYVVYTVCILISNTCKQSKFFLFLCVCALFICTCMYVCVCLCVRVLHVKVCQIFFGQAKFGIKPHKATKKINEQ